MGRTVATNTVLIPTDVPSSLRDAYFGNCALIGDWSAKEMTNASIVSCTYEGWKPPGDPAQPRGRTRNHHIYLRFGQNLPGLTPPDYIPWDAHELVAALFSSRLAQLRGPARLFAEEVTAWVATNYYASWEPGWGRFAATYGERVVDQAVQGLVAGHPELESWWAGVTRATRSPDLTTDSPIALPDGTPIDAVRLATLFPAVNSHDRWAYERELEAFLPQYVAGQPANPADVFRVHIWQLIPFRVAYGFHASPDWWIGKVGG